MIDRHRGPRFGLSNDCCTNSKTAIGFFWLDADTVVMNSHKRVEDFLPADDANGNTIDILLAIDKGGGYNAGVWLVRNSEWTARFLQEWWDMERFVLEKGLTKSGDNDALKYKTSMLMNQDQLKHIGVPPQCTFNSFARFVQPEEYQDIESGLKDHEWYMQEASYH